MSTEPHYKLCPACGMEYILVATRCADCDVELVHGDALAAEEEDLEAFPPASELECVRVAPIAWIQALSEALQQRGVAHRVEPASAEDTPDGQRPDIFGDAQLFGLYVQTEHASMTRELDGSIAAQVLPEEAPTLAEDEEEACPACSTALAADATECPDCGLRFG
jgi:predicted RNA-binding Zn-ribbon protein involved in translation (DUF1610 family)